MQDRADKLTAEVDEINQRLILISALSNISLQLYSWYIKNGHARNAADAGVVAAFLTTESIQQAQDAKGFYERLYLYQYLAGTHLSHKNFLLYYRYCQKWVDLFDADPKMIEIKQLIISRVYII